jgi:hypothetical protein
MITGLQVRAARGFLCWDRGDLAKKAIVPLSTVERMEMGEQLAGVSAKVVDAIQGTMEAEGIEFLDDGDAPGVRLHEKHEKPARRTTSTKHR